MKKILFNLSLSVLSTLVMSSAHAHMKLVPQMEMAAFVGPGIEDYRIGSGWGKRALSAAGLKKETPAFQRAALATVFLPVGGTGFYLGKFAGKHVIATNHHVCPTERDCLGDQADFRLLKKRYKISKFYITLPNVDLSLLAIDIPAADEKLMSTVARNFAFNKDIQKGMDLITIGFGVGGNPSNNIMGNNDSDCKVFSQTGEYKLLADPDELNPADYKAWSFSHGCDVSHGDSGSAMVDRATSDVVGIVWTGKIPKAPIAQDSAALTEMLKTSSPLIWKELAFAVPAVKIKAFLIPLTTDSQLDAETKSVFKALIK
jgi:hypothetical protein